MWILLVILLTLLAGAAVLLPFVRAQAAIIDIPDLTPRLTELYARRDMLYQAVRDARFDLQTGKLSLEDYQEQATRLKLEAANVLRAIDEVEAELVSPELDAQIEADVAAARAMPASLKVSVSNGEVKAAAADRFCGKCGARLRPGDRFCGKCGAGA